MIKIFPADMLLHLYVRAIQRTNGERAVQGKFHITGAEASVPASEIRSDSKSAAGMITSADAVVRDKHHFQPSPICGSLLITSLRR